MSKYTSYVLANYGNYQVLAIRCKSLKQEQKVKELLWYDNLHKYNCVTDSSDILCNEFMTALNYIRSQED